jgi:hypothetical protein
MKELKDISKQNPYKVPENYFEEVNRKILLATSGSEAEKRKDSLVRRMNPWLSIAASVAVLFVMGLSAVLIFKGNSHNQTAPQITLNEFTDIFGNDIDILTLEEKVAGNEQFLELSELTKKDIVDYLVFENIDILDIYEKL